MEHKSLPFRVGEIKAQGDGWEVAGYASTFGGEPDAYGDVVARGAFADSLLKRPDVRLLWQHDMAEPIGKALALKEDEQGLLGHWSLVPTDTGTKAHQLLAAGLVDALSIGFMTKDAEYREDGTRILKAVDLLEVSLVTIPANANAVVTSFKADVPFDLLLMQVKSAWQAAVQEAEALYARRQADGRSLNDKHRAAVDDLVGEVKATLDRIEATTRHVVTPEARAEVSEIELRLEIARRRLRHAGILRESA